jgi:hypothetical protein
LPKILPVMLAGERAWHVDPDAAALWRAGQQRWLAGARRLADWLAREERLAPPWTVATAADMIWSLMSPDLLNGLMHERHWSPKRIGKHLAVLLTSTFVRDQGGHPMYAIIRKNTYDPAKLAHASPALAEFRELHAAQPGYAGSIDVDAGDGQRVIVNLWQTEQDARAGMTVLVPHLQRLLEPLMTSPSQLVGVGEVAASDLTRQR